MCIRDRSYTGGGAIVTFENVQVQNKIPNDFYSLNIEAVSYTHLDVYKRQGVFGGVAYTVTFIIGYHPFGQTFSDNYILNLSWVIFAPVSYTHLE